MVKVSKEKIKTICELLTPLNIHEKGRIINWLLDDIEIQGNIEFINPEFTKFLKKSCFKD